MKRIGTITLVCLLVFAGFAGLVNISSENARAATSITGGAVSGVWNQAGSPYWIEGDINVPTGNTLEIWDGTEVRFNGAYSLQVQGTLIANGTESSVVRFTSNVSVSPGKGDWRGVRIQSGLLTGQGTFEYCNFSYAGRALVIQSGNNRVTNSSFFMNRNGTELSTITPVAPADDNIIENSTYSYNNNSIVISDASNNRISNSTISQSENGTVITSAIPFFPSSYNKVENSTYTSNINGIYLSSVSNTSFLYNNISYNMNGIVSDFFGGMPFADHNILIRNNITHNTENGTLLFNINLFGNPSQNYIFDNNMSFNNMSLTLAGSEGDRVINNTITNNSMGAQVVGLSMIGLPSGNNTVSGNEIYGSSTSGIYMSSSVNTNRSEDNVIRNNNGGNANPQVTSGVEIGTNLCATNTTCP